MTKTISRAQYAEMAKQPKRNKFNAQKTVLDGIIFDSKAEANYYAVLKQRERADEIAEVELQPRYIIEINGVVICVVRLDFEYWDCREKRTRTIDVKGVDTPVSRLKRKMVQAQYGIDVEIVK